ncbi:MAG: hypothetical protein WBG15_01705, partial [Xanthobacteraceae bacterium]
MFAVASRRVLGKHRLKPGDPVAARAGFAVRQPLDACAQRGAHLREDVVRIRHRHAADEVDVPAHSISGADVGVDFEKRAHRFFLAGAR